MKTPIFHRVAKSRPLQVTLMVVVGISALAGGWAYRNHQRYKHFVVHDANRVYRSGWIEADAMAEIVHRYGLHTVVNLCNPGEMGNERWEAERAAVQNAGAKLVELPMSLEVSSDEQLIAPHVALLRNPDSYPLLVHCQHGVTRTAKFLLLYDVLIRGTSPEESLSAMPLFGRDDHNVHVRAFAKLMDAKLSEALTSEAAIQSSARR